MNYEKKYKEALRKARVYHTGGSINDTHITEVIFPELKESDDERIRKELIAIYSVGAKVNAKTGDISDKDIVTWLEKQGEKQNTINVLPSLGNNQVQDILEDMGMLDDNGQCSHTAEEIFKAGMEYKYNLNHKAVSSVILDVDILTELLRKHLYTCVNKTNTYVRSEEDHITLAELIDKIKVDLNIK